MIWQNLTRIILVLLCLVSTEGVDWVVVELPVSNVVLVVELNMFPDTSQFALLNPQGSQVSSHLSLVQLSPNRVRFDFDLDTIDVFAASPRSGGYLPLISPVSSLQSPSSHASPDAGSLPDEAAASRDSAIGSPATSLSITDHTADLHLMTPPLIPIPDMVFLQADPALLLELTQTYYDFLPPQEPVPI